MTDGTRTAAPEDPKHRLISLFVGAVLLPSLALSYVAFDFVQRLAKERKKSEIKRAEETLYWVEKELSHTAQARARDAARVVGTERLVDGRKEVIQAALREAGMQDDIFESLHLEGPASRLIVKNQVERARAGSGELSARPADGRARDARRHRGRGLRALDRRGRAHGRQRCASSSPAATSTASSSASTSRASSGTRSRRWWCAWPEPDGVDHLRERGHPGRRLRGEARDGERRPSRASSSSCATATPRSSRT